MSNTSRREYLESIKPRYREASKDEKNKILDEFCYICGYNRKYAIRVLNQKSSPKYFWEIHKRGPKKKYDHPDIIKVLTKIWVNTNLPCSKRLKAIIPIWSISYNRKDKRSFVNHFSGNDRSSVGEIPIQIYQTGIGYNQAGLDIKKTYSS